MIKDANSKKTVLDNSAEIYKRREKESEKEKLSNMTFGEKVSYFKQYYLAKSVIITAVLVLAVYFLYTVLSPKPEKLLYVAILDYAMDEASVNTVSEDMEKVLNINNDKQELIFDSAFSLGGAGIYEDPYLATGEDNEMGVSSSAEMTMANQQKLVAYVFAGDIDVIIAPEMTFQHFAAIGYFSKLSDELPTGLFSSLSDSYLYGSTEDDPASSPYGIYLDGAPIYDNKGQIMNRPVLGILGNSKNKENTIKLIQYLFQLD